MTLTMTNEELRALIPNVIHEVEGETLLVDKIRPWLDTATNYLADNIIGNDFEVPERLLPLVKRIVVFIAFANAIPSLDLSLTPAGFSVISTEGRAPASKERVERLIASLNASADAQLPPLISSLLRMEDWRATPMGHYWTATFMNGLDDAQAARRDKSLLDTYVSMRDIALRFQTLIQQDYIGKNLVKKALEARFSPIADPDLAELAQMLRRAELRYISFHARDQKAKCPDDHELWHLMQPILFEIDHNPSLFEIWNEEMGPTFAVEPFKNTRKGGYFF